MKYFVFIDESGNPQLKNFNPEFPVFTLCSIMISEVDYEELRKEINVIKRKYWNNKKIILHSRDIRKHQNGFEILFDLKVKEAFYNDISNLIKSANYTIIACSIQKDVFVKKYGQFGNIYGQCLSYIMERSTYFLSKECKNGEIEIVAEKRGAKEDKELLSYYNKLIDSGTYFVTPTVMKQYFKQFNFKWKRENINGLQLADLIAYPIARHVIDPERVNIPFEIFESKFYQSHGKIYGNKIYPNERKK